MEKQVSRILNHACRRIDSARHADANFLDISHFKSGFFHNILAQRRHRITNFVLWSWHGSFAAHLGNNFALVVYNSGDNIGAAKVNSQMIHSNIPFFTLYLNYMQFFRSKIQVNYSICTKHNKGNKIKICNFV